MVLDAPSAVHIPRNCSFRPMQEARRFDLEPSRSRGTAVEHGERRGEQAGEWVRAVKTVLVLHLPPAAAILVNT